VSRGGVALPKKTTQLRRKKQKVDVYFSEGGLYGKKLREERSGAAYTLNKFDGNITAYYYIINVSRQWDNYSRTSQCISVVYI